MSVVTIPNQLAAFDFPINDCDSCYDADYCSPVPEGETVDFQFKQTPCGPNLNCDPAFNKISDQLTTDPTFTGGLGTWTASNGQWAYGANNAHFDNTLGAPGGTLSQPITTTTLKQYKWYILKMDIGTVTGSLALVATLGGIGSPTIITAGGSNILLLLQCGVGADLSFYNVPGAATFNIDNIELYELSPCWEGAEGWNFGLEGAVTHAFGTSQLNASSAPLTSGTYYQAVVTIYNYVSGSVKVVAGTTQSDAISGEGSTVVYLTANGTGLGLLPTTDFVGTISYFVIKKLKNDYTFGVLDTIGGIEYTTGAIAEYYRDFVTAKIDPMLYIPDPVTCFKIVIHDVCDEYSDTNLVYNGNFIQGSNGMDRWYGPGNFIPAFKAVQYPPVSGGLLRQYYDGLTYEIVGAGGEYLTCTKFYWSYTVRGPVSTDSYVNLGIGNNLLGHTEAAGIITGVTTTPAPDSNSIRIVGGVNALAPVTDYIIVDDVEIRCITSIDRVLTSQCFIIYTNDDCIREIEANCDKAAFGFAFQIPSVINPFKTFSLRSWVKLQMFDPIFPEQQSNYVYSDGTKKINWSSSDELIDMKTDFLPEWVHRNLRIMKICDHFYINGVEYVCKDGDYLPEYLEGENIRLSSVQLQLRPKTILLQNNNCG